MQLKRRALIHNTILRPLFKNNYMTSHEVTFGEQYDISRLTTFGWYEWIYYRNHGSFPQP